ncbi:hypothetical protein WICPIJ_006837 [Wickerhamomyces pijperi]|uniref:Uncharacterized protein n=1 Tax=Wickerhamomyces pijperi TaxID=599730 RepID=A0A9P8TKI8_WICPI|nr:hypothetical protein WICPIJ_006837 [Wickerhamomyces pijperi]
MKLSKLVIAPLLLVSSLFQLVTAVSVTTDIGTSATTLSGISTVTTAITYSVDDTNNCHVKSFTSAMGGRSFKAYNTVQNVEASTLLVFNYKSTVTWVFAFDEAPNADDFAVLANPLGFVVGILGPAISSVRGEVNLHDGSFLMQYDVTFTGVVLVDLVTMPLNVLVYCINDYFAFRWKISDGFREDYYIAYAGNVISAVTSLVEGLLCGLTDCNIYKAMLDFNCDDIDYTGAKCSLSNNVDTTLTHTTTSSISPSGSSTSGAASSSGSSVVSSHFSSSVISSTSQTVPSAYITTVVDSAGVSETEEVSFYPTTNSNGKWVTATTTRDLSASAVSSSDPSSSAKAAGSISGLTTNIGTSATTLSGISTVTTAITYSVDDTNNCHVKSFTSAMGGRSFKAYNTVQNVEASTLLVFNYKSTVTWVFAFDEAPNADDFAILANPLGFVVGILGPAISSVRGEVNLHDGAFLMQYDVTFTGVVLVDLVTMPLNVLVYCINDYFAFRWKINDGYQDNYYIAYAGNVISAVTKLVEGLLCGLTNCNIYTAMLDFNCDDIDYTGSKCTSSNDIHTTLTRSAGSTISSSASSTSASASYFSASDVSSHMSSSVLSSNSQTIPSDYTTTVVDSAGASHTDEVSFYPTSGSDGAFATGTTTITLTVPSDYTTTVVDSAGVSHTDDVSFYPTTNSDGNWATGTTTRELSGSASGSVSGSASTVPSDYTTTVVDSAGVSHTDEVSFYPTSGSDGAFATGTTTITLTVPSDYTTTVVDSAGSSHTDDVSFYPTTNSDGDWATGTTTRELSGSASGSASGSGSVPASGSASELASSGVLSSSISGTVSSSNTGSSPVSQSVSIVTVTAESSTLVTITSCSGFAGCKLSTALTGVTVVTTTINSVETVYTTYCPLTATTSVTIPGSLETLSFTSTDAAGSTVVYYTHASSPSVDNGSVSSGASTGTKATFGSYDVFTYTTQSLVTDTIVYCPLTNSEGQTTSSLIIPSDATGAVEGTTFHTSDLLTTTSVHVTDVTKTQIVSRTSTVATVTEGAAQTYGVTDTTTATTEPVNYKTGSTSTSSAHPTSPVVYVSNDAGLALQANVKSLTIGALTFLVYALF